MKRVINLLLVGLALFFAYWLFDSIREPIAFSAAKSEREQAVIAVLKKLQIAQDVYKMSTGEYANDFDKMSNVLKNDSISIINITEDPSDPENDEKYIRTIIKKPAKDTLFSLLQGSVNIDSLRYVPYGNGKTFTMQTDTVEYQSTDANVVLVGTFYKDFMGQYADKKYRKYDNYYDPDKMLKFGDLNSPNTNGNW